MTHQTTWSLGLLLTLILMSCFGNRAAAKSAEAISAKDSIYGTVATMPEFVGGQEACLKYISENVRYPFVCEKTNYGGRVIVQFVVEKNGRVKEVKAIRRPEDHIVTPEEAIQFKTAFPEHSAEVREGVNLADLLSDEAVRVVKSMPRWKPGRNDEGKKVRTRFAIPLMFRPNPGN